MLAGMVDTKKSLHLCKELGPLGRLSMCERVVQDPAERKRELSMLASSVQQIPRGFCSGRIMIDKKWPHTQKNHASSVQHKRTHVLTCGSGKLGLLGRLAMHGHSDDHEELGEAIRRKRNKRRNTAQTGMA